MGQDHHNQTTHMRSTEILKLKSSTNNLTLAIIHQQPKIILHDYPVLFLHGSSFPSALSFGFEMDGISWMSHLAAKGFDVYALDFLGYGHSSRYPEMQSNDQTGTPLGKAQSASQDVDRAINYIKKKTGKEKISLIGHSWGGSVAALYASEHSDQLAQLVLFAAITPRYNTGAESQLKISYKMLTPDQRMASLRDLTPSGYNCQLENEIFETWGDQWLKSDPFVSQQQNKFVKYPAGPNQDVEDLLHDKAYYDPTKINTPTLVIRGEWDQYPNNEDCGQLFSSLKNSPYKKYVVIEKGTHVMHLEKSRHELYYEVDHFLNKTSTKQKTERSSIAVIFEVIPHEKHWQQYLDLAAELKPELEKIEGFISIERFKSITQPEKILSLSFWKDETSLKQWRNLEIHRGAQQKGREFIFKNYRLRVAQVIRDYGMLDRKEAPQDSRDYLNTR